MKTNKLKQLSSGLLLLCFCFFLAPSMVSGQTDAGQQQYRFTNNEGANATDLHIEFNSAPTFVPPNPNPNGDVTHQTPSGTFPTGNGSGSTSINLANGLTGAVVAPGGSVTLTLGFTGARAPSVRRWWWTNDNDLDPTDGRLGRVKQPRRGRFDLASVPSTGDGQIKMKRIGEAVSEFDMPPGLTGEAMATALGDFIDNDVPWLGVESIDGSTVMIFPTSLSEEIDDFTVEIIPDSTQLVDFKYDPEVIPTLSQWGVIILLLLVLAVGMVFLYQRQTSLAIAGVAAVSNSKPKLFDRKLFTKVFAAALLIGIAGLVAAYLYYGQITNADPFGTVVSAGIVAYMAHLWLMRKSDE